MNRCSFPKKTGWLVCKEVWNCFSKVPNVIQPVGTTVSVARSGKQNNWALEDYAQEKQWKLTCTPRFFFSLSLHFFYEHTEKLHTIFFYSPLVFLDQWMPKKSYFDREDKSDGNSLVHHRLLFFLSQEFSYEHPERFLTIFSYAMLVFLE